MNGKKKEIIALIALVMLLLAINYAPLDKSVEDFLMGHRSEVVLINRVIDGDTIVTGNRSVRLLGINTPERGEPYYAEAKKFLESKVLNKTVRLEFGKEKYDLYERTLAYVFLDEENVNFEIVKNGFANYYFPAGKDIYYGDFKEAWNFCIENGKNLCERSKDVCSACIELKEFGYGSDEAVFYNKCSLSCDLTSWSIKDEGRKNFVFPKFLLNPNSGITIKTGNRTDTNKILFWRGETYVWTSTGDTLFLRDKEGKLVLWEGY